MSKIVECVPNFSEGIRSDVISEIANAIKSTEGCSLLDVDPGASTNRTVYTFVGEPDRVVEGAFNAAKVAQKHIDMSKHHGEHPRLGAMDVCPFIPVKGVTMQECIECANLCAQKLANELNISSFLYGAASKHDYRRTTSQIRSGEYEALKDRLKDPLWKPDYGPVDFNAGWGASLLGARNFLIAYNVNMIATKEQAHRIALDIREQGRGENQPGKFKCVQAIGWYLEEEDMAQISINITDINVTKIHEVYEECVAIAKELDLPVVGSQIVGLVPLQALVEAAQFYINKENLFVVNEADKIRLAIERLGLNSVSQFKPKERIIEYMVTQESELLSLSVQKYVRTVAQRSPTPGGGCVAALCASLGSGLGTMASYLTFGNKKFAHLDQKMRPIIAFLHQKTEELMTFVEKDAAAFNLYMTALKLPKKSPEELQMRQEAMERALDTAVDVPFSLMKSINQCWPTLMLAAPLVNAACLSDIQVGVRCLETGVWGGHYNVLANIKNMENKKEASEIHESSKKEVSIAVENSKKVLDILDERYLKE